MLSFEKNSISGEKIIGFLQKYETFCAGLCASVRRGEPNIYVFSDKEKPGDIKSSSDILGVIQVDSTLLHCLSPGVAERADFKSLFLNLVSGKKITCLEGEKKSNEILSLILEEKGFVKYFQNEYFLMTKEDVSDLPPPASLLSMGEEIVCCKSDHEEDLYELQKNYLNEEVVPPGKWAGDLYVRSNVKSILKNQKVFAIESDGKFVAKVNTNAIGFNWVQIGGVYTDPLYRRNGYSTCLLSTLCRRINKTGRKSVLFVKKKNLPAVSLYEKLGFIKSGEFEIIYFE